MNALLEAAKQALEALEELSGTGILYKETPFQAYMRVRQMADLPISLLSQAIEQAEKQETYCWVSGGIVYYKESDIPRGKTIVPLYTAPPQQEPLTATFKYQTYGFNTEKGGFYSEEKTHEL